MIFAIAAYTDESKFGIDDFRRKIEDNVFDRVFDGIAVERFEAPNTIEAIDMAAYYMYNFLMRSIKDSERKVKLVRNEKDPPIIIINSGTFSQVIRFAVYKDENRMSHMYKNMSDDELLEILSEEGRKGKEAHDKIHKAEKYKLYTLEAIRSAEYVNHKWFTFNLTVSAQNRKEANIKFSKIVMKRFRDFTYFSAAIQDAYVEYYFEDEKSIDPNYLEDIEGFTIDYCEKYHAKNGVITLHCRFTGRALEYKT